jgi:hypothetical protein
VELTKGTKLCSALAGWLTGGNAEETNIHEALTSWAMLGLSSCCLQVVTALPSQPLHVSVAPAYVYEGDLCFFNGLTWTCKELRSPSDHCSRSKAKKATASPMHLLIWGNPTLPRNSLQDSEVLQISCWALTPIFSQASGQPRLTGIHVT